MDVEGLKKVIGAYDLSSQRFLPSQKGYRNTSFPVELKNGERVNFILYKNEPGIYERIRRIHKVSSFLAERTFPVRRPLRPKIVKLQTSKTVRYGALYTYLPGNTIPWEGYTRDHIKLVGMVMGEMHVALQEFGYLDNEVTVEYIATVRRMQRYFEDESVRRALQQKVGVDIPKSLFLKLQTLLAYCQTLPSQQVLHMDFVRGNLLFDAPQKGDRFVIGDIALSGILDFEKTAYGPPVIDVARTLAFLLVDCKYKNPEKVWKYFLHSGYNKRSSAMNIPLDSQLLNRLIRLFLVHDFYKFLRHNPYESLSQNEHFVRTRDMLLSFGVIRYTKDR